MGKGRRVGNTSHTGGLVVSLRIAITGYCDHFATLGSTPAPGPTALPKPPSPVRHEIVLLFGALLVSSNSGYRPIAAPAVCGESVEWPREKGLVVTSSSSSASVVLDDVLPRLKKKGSRMSLVHRSIPCVLASVGVALTLALAMGCGDHAPAPIADRPNPQPEPEAEDVSEPVEYGSVQYADESNFENLVFQAAGPVLVDFYADWCPPCRLQAPILDELAREEPHLLIVKVDVDQAPNLAAQYGVSSIPNIKVFRDGEIVGEHVGVADKAQLKSLMGT